MKDGLIRRGIKRLARWHFVANLVLYRAWRRTRGDRNYRLGGECRRCARCCETPAIQVGRITWYLPAARALFLWWQGQVNGFALKSKDISTRTFTFECAHFDWATRSCDSYDSRPGICRDYPRALLSQPNPELLPGCGYRPIAFNARRLSLLLDAQPLTEEQKAKLRRNLYLEE
jgi:Fe-S-cluster containining protein